MGCAFGQDRESATATLTTRIVAERHAMLVIGDVHGKQDQYCYLTRHYRNRSEYSVQLGDVGFVYDDIADLDPEFHCFIPGNHDNYDNLPPQALKGSCGVLKRDDVQFFWVRGGLSVDKQWRVEGKSWWAAEELDLQQCEETIELYRATKPDLVFSHDCPHSMVPLFITNDAKITKSRTGQLLDSLLDYHRPDFWIFGHHHQTKTVNVDRTMFQCLGELEIMEITQTDCTYFVRGIEQHKPWKE